MDEQISDGAVLDVRSSIGMVRINVLFRQGLLVHGRDYWGEAMSQAETGPVGQRQIYFLASYVLVFVAAFVALTPVLQIIVPLHAGRIDPADKTRILSQAMFWGAATAAISNVAVGALSDRTRSRFGRRRPWLAAGALLMVVTYMGIAQSRSPLQLTLAVMAFQVAFNMMMAPMLALFAERVGLAQRTTMSALLGVCYPLAVAVGSGLMALGPATENGRLILLSLILLAVVLPFVLLFPEPVGAPYLRAPGRDRPEFRGFLAPFKSRNFSLVWGGRLSLSTGYALVSAYLLYFVAEAFRAEDRSAELSHSILTSVALGGVFVVAGVVAVLGGRLKSRKSAALAGAVLLCGATGGAALSEQWGFAVACFLIYGIGQGAYGAVEMGLMADALPDRQGQGKDMGLINLTVALPQALAPVIAVVVQQSGGETRALFLGAALCFGAGAVLISALKPLRRLEEGSGSKMV